MSEPTGSPFFQCGNWNRVDHMGNQLLYRILAEDEQYIYVMKLGYLETEGPRILRPPRNMSYREKWKRSTAERLLEEKKLTHMGERTLTEEMTMGVVRPDDQAKFDHRKMVVDDMVERWGERLVTDKQAHIDAVKLAKSIYLTDCATITKWLEQYYFFGKHDFALISQHSNKGKTGPRRGARDEKGKLRKLGRKVDGQDANKKDQRLLITAKVARECTAYVESAVANGAIDLSTTIDGFIETRFSYSKDRKTNEKVCYNVSIEKLGGVKNLRRFAGPIFKNACIKREILRKFESRRRVRISGSGSRVIVHDQLPVLDIDGTTADNQVRYNGRLVHIPGRGKPTLMLGADRGSNAIVGYYVTFKPENADCYRELMKSVFSPKERDLIFHQVQFLEGFVYGFPSKIFIDRGPGMAKKFQDAIAALKISSLAAAPGDPQGKGLIEGIMNHVQRALSSLPGSTYKLGDEEVDFKRKKDSETVDVSYDDFMQALLIAISHWNTEVDNRLLLTDDMKDKGILPTPEAVYLYYKTLLRGDAAFVWPMEDVFRKLYPSKQRKVDDDGIVEFEQGYFHSDDLFATALHYKRTHGKSMEITVYDLGHNGMHLLWDCPDGNLGLLEACADTATIRAPSRRLAQMSNQIGNALYREALKRSRRNRVAVHRHYRNRNAMSQKHVAEMVAADKIAAAHAEAMLPTTAEARKAAIEELNAAQLEHSLGAINLSTTKRKQTQAVVPKTPAYKKPSTIVLVDGD
ncbi:UNVERIFIED_ORG: hypothetical protein DFO49_4424 [Herbaspirillum seropedicae]